jgi:hypothetical protein
MLSFVVAQGVGGRSNCIGRVPAMNGPSSVRKSKLRLSAQRQLAAVSWSKVEHCFATSELMPSVEMRQLPDWTLIAFCLGTPRRTDNHMRQFNGKVQR